MVLEAERVGWGASGRNGGFVGPGYATSHANITRMVGSREAQALHRLSIEGVRIVEDNIDSLAMSDNTRVYGKMSVLRYHDPDGLARHCEMMKREFGYHLEVMPTEAVRDVLRSQKYHQALYDPRASISTRSTMPGLWQRRSRRSADGSSSDRGSPAAISTGAEKVVRTARGEVRARDVILAGGGYTDDLVPRLRRSILPIATYVLLTEAAPERSRRRCARRWRSATTAVPATIIASSTAESGFSGAAGSRRATTEPRRLAEMMQKTMVSTYPQLEGVRVETAWSGLMAYARHLMPLIGQLQPGVWYVFGFGGRGMNTTAIGGRVIAEGILGTSDRYRLYEPFGLVWNGGPFGVAAAQLTYWTYQAMDLAKERRAARAA